MGPRCWWDQGLNCSPDGIKHFGLECAHDNEVLHLVVGCWVALGIKPEPTRRPVDGHLSARPLRRTAAFGETPDPRHLDTTVCTGHCCIARDPDEWVWGFVPGPRRSCTTTDIGGTSLVASVGEFRVDRPFDLGEQCNSHNSAEVMGPCSNPSPKVLSSWESGHIGSDAPTGAPGSSPLRMEVGRRLRAAA